MKNNPDAANIISCLKNEAFSSAVLRDISEAAKEALLRVALNKAKEDASLQHLTDILRDLRKAVVVSGNQQQLHADSIQALLDGLAGVSIVNLETCKFIVDSLNQIRESCGLAFYSCDQGRWHRVTLRARRKESYRTCEFVVETTTRHKKRLGEKPRTEFPVLSVMSPNSAGE